MLTRFGGVHLLFTQQLHEDLPELAAAEAIDDEVHAGVGHHHEIRDALVEEEGLRADSLVP